MKKRTIQEVKEDLEESQAKLKEVQEKGDKAISQWDLDNGYDAEFYLNCPREGDGMLYAHVSYYQNELNKLVEAGEQLSLLT